MWILLVSAAFDEVACKFTNLAIFTARRQDHTDSVSDVDSWVVLGAPEIELRYLALPYIVQLVNLPHPGMLFNHRIPEQLSTLCISLTGSQG